MIESMVKGLHNSMMCVSTDHGRGFESLCHLWISSSTPGCALSQGPSRCTWSSAHTVSPCNIFTELLIVLKNKIFILDGMLKLLFHPRCAETNQSQLQQASF
jgi:hypothetical protein